MSEGDDTPERVFVYGTLKPGERNAHVAAAAGPFTFRAGWIEGFDLLDLDPEAYPGIVPAAQEGRVVHGVLLEYDAATFDVAPLDALEGLADEPPLYERLRVRVLPWRLEAWTYVFARPDRLARPGCTRVETGNWSEAQRPHHLRNESSEAKEPSC